MSLWFSINSSKYVHFWTLVVQKILILANFSFQQYISCRHFNFDPLTPTYENGHQCNFLQFWRSRICVFCDLCHNFYFLWTQNFYGTLYFISKCIHTIPWENLYAFLPFVILKKVLQKVISGKCTAPNCPTQLWYS